MDDFEVIRLLAMDIITKTAYHAFPEKARFFSGHLPIGGASTASRCLRDGVRSQ